MANPFIAMCYAAAKKAGVDTSKMSPDEVVEWYNEHNKQGGGTQGGGDKKQELKQAIEKAKDREKLNKEGRQENLKNNDSYRNIKSPKEVLDKNIQRNEVTFKDSKVIANLQAESDEHFNEKISSMSGDHAKDKTEDLILKEVLIEKGYLGKPFVTDTNTFNEMVSRGANVLFRGVPIDNYSDQLRDSEDVFIGRGFTTNGLWFSHDENKAKDYAKGKDIARVILHPKAKIAKLSDLDIDNFKFDDEYEGMKLSKDRRFEMFSKGKAGAIAIFCALKGYDAIDKGHDDIVVLNRSALIMEEKHEQK